jgi:hypothetical protein
MDTPTDGWAMTPEEGPNNLEMKDATMDGAGPWHSGNN